MDPSTDLTAQNVSNPLPDTPDGRLARFAAVGGALAYTAMTAIALMILGTSTATPMAIGMWAVCLAVAAITYRSGSRLEARSRTMDDPR